jgi:1-acyl-sn-glycerol-3-phosphate acyltransferase
VRTPILDVFRPLLLGLTRLYFGLELHGADRVPASGPLLITPNHQSFADPPLVTIPVHRPVYYMAWSRLFAIPGFGWFIRRLRAFPVDLDARDSRATRETIRLLRAGEAVMIVPEGGRSADGRVGAFKLGAFRLAASLGVPVLPVSIAGAHEAWPPGRRLPRPGRITITYHPAEYPDPTLEVREAARRLAERAHAVIARSLAATSRA